jgi:hypothetical protein
MMHHQGMLPDFLTMDDIRQLNPQQKEEMLASYTRQHQAASAALADLGEARRNMDVLHQQQNQNASSLNSDVGLMACIGVRTESQIQMMITTHAMTPTPDGPSTTRPVPPGPPAIIMRVSPRRILGYLMTTVSRRLLGLLGNLVLRGSPGRASISEPLISELE